MYFSNFHVALLSVNFRKLSAELVLKEDEAVSKDVHYIVILAHTFQRLFYDEFMSRGCQKFRYHLCKIYHAITINC